MADKTFFNELTGKHELKGEVSLSDPPSGARPDLSPPANLRSASEYSRATVERQRMLREAKAPRTTLGGPPIDPKKMAAIAAMGAEAAAAQARPQFPPWAGEAGEKAVVPAPPKPQFAGVGAAYDYNQRMARGEVSRPESLADASRAELGAEAPQVVPTQELQAGAQPVEADQADIDRAEEEAAQESMLERFTRSQQLPDLDQVRTMLLSGDRRKKIEESLKPMSLEDLIVHGEVQQSVPIVPGKYELTIRSLKQHENEFCLQEVFGMGGSDQFILERMNLCRLTCALVSLNGSYLPEHRTNVGDFEKEEVDKKLFSRKLRALLTQSVTIIMDLAVQYDWFVVRVNRLISLDAIKNG